MKYSLSLGIVLAAVWLAWSGHFTPLLLSFGAASVLLTVVLAHRLGATDAEGAPLQPLLRSVTYLPWLLKEIVVANLDVARRIIDPRLPIQPRIFRTCGTQSTDVGKVIYANSITLTPGTVTLRMDDDGLLIHALTADAADSVPGGPMDRRVTAIEGKP